MIQKALPEGVLEPKGSISGYLYFEKLPPQTNRMVFLANLLNAKTDKIFGRIKIPFVVK